MGPPNISFALYRTILGRSNQLRSISVPSRILERRDFRKTSPPAMALSSSVQADEAFLGYILDLVKSKRLLPGRQTLEDPVVKFVHPAQLEDLMGVDIGKEPATEDALKEICEKVVEYSVKTSNPNFYNQLYGGVDGMGLAGAWLSDALNTNAHTFEVAPVFLIVERGLCRYIMSKFGYESGDGIFSPGGSISNMYGMILARHKKFPELKATGLYGRSPLVAFTSDESHYSIAKGANWLGIGTENVVKVKTDDNGRMIPEELENEIQKTLLNGKTPFFVNATSGSTVLGAYDPLSELSDVCRKHDLWLHVDACWGGAAILSDKHKHLLRGIEKSDSIAWNVHKLLCAPVQASPFVTRHAGLLHEANSASARYLFQQDKFYDVSYDTGDKSVQCGRKVDAFKVWLMLKARGEKRLAEAVDNVFEMAEYLTHLVKTTEGFRLVFPDAEEKANCANICFHFIPPSLRQATVEDAAFWDSVYAAPPRIKERMVAERGSVLVGYQPLAHKGLGNCFRVVLPANPAPTKQDMDYLIREIEDCGKDL